MSSLVVHQIDNSVTDQETQDNILKDIEEDAKEVIEMSSDDYVPETDAEMVITTAEMIGWVDEPKKYEMSSGRVYSAFYQSDLALIGDEDVIDSYLEDVHVEGYRQSLSEKIDGQI